MLFSPPFISPGSGPNTKFDRLPRGEYLQAQIPLRYFMFTFCCSIFSPFCAPACIRGTPPMSKISSKSVSRHLRALYIKTSWVSWMCEKHHENAQLNAELFKKFSWTKEETVWDVEEVISVMLGKPAKGQVFHNSDCVNHINALSSPPPLNCHTQLCSSHWFI